LLVIALGAGFFAPSSALAGDRDGRVEALIEAAHQRDLASDKTWLRLGHWRHNWTGGFTSEADGDDFFLEDRHRAARSYNVVVNALLWKAAMRASTSALAGHGHDRIYLLHYEALVENPDRTLRGLADWLGVTYESKMLDVPVAYSSYEMPRSGISTQPLERWREKLTATEISAVQTCCGRVMAELGYRRENVAAPLHRLIWTWATVPTAFARAALANRKRLGRASEYVRRRLLLTVSRSG